LIHSDVTPQRAHRRQRHGEAQRLRPREGARTDGGATLDPAERRATSRRSSSATTTKSPSPRASISSRSGSCSGALIGTHPYVESCPPGRSLQRWISAQLSRIEGTPHVSDAAPMARRSARRLSSSCSACRKHARLLREDVSRSSGRTCGRRARRRSRRLASATPLDWTRRDSVPDVCDQRTDADAGHAQARPADRSLRLRARRATCATRTTTATGTPAATTGLDPSPRPPRIAAPSSAAPKRGAGSVGGGLFDWTRLPRELGPAFERAPSYSMPPKARRGAQ
jgi:hypothetical protein